MTFRRLFTGLAGAGILAAAGASPAAAQELVHRFLNPSFGGNPFYSEHLLATANIHRPAAPTEPEDPPLTEEELIAEQIRSRLLSTLSTDISSRIQNAQPGESGEFVLGDSRINFTRTQTETRVTFLNTRTGESRLIVIPVRTAGSGFFSTSVGSAEQALGAGPVELPLGRF